MPIEETSHNELSSTLSLITQPHENASPAFEMVDCTGDDLKKRQATPLKEMMTVAISADNNSSCDRLHPKINPLVQTILRIRSKSWNVGGLLHCHVGMMSESMWHEMVQLEGTIFTSRLVPRPWTIQFSKTAFGSTFAVTSTSATGRLNILLPKCQVDGCDARALEFMNNLEALMPDYLSSMGFTRTEVSAFRVVQIGVHIPFQRSQRLPFINTGVSSSKPFEDVLIIMPFRRSKPVAIWDKRNPCLKDGTPECVVPDLSPGQVLLLTVTPFCLLSCTNTETGELSSPFIFVHISSVYGHVLTKGCGSFGDVLNDLPEKWLLSTTDIPPIRSCVICCGAIRDRRHGDLSGDRSRSDHGCLSYHCGMCRASNPTGPYFLCEFCVLTTLGPCFISEDDVLRDATFGNSIGVACSSYFKDGHNRTCVHVNPVSNNIVDNLFLIFRLTELRAAAKFFRDFFRHGTWHESFAPQSLKQMFENGHSQDLWEAFYQIFCANSHCPRVKAVCYAMQCALNIGPVLRRIHARVEKRSRELFLCGDLASKYNEDGFYQCVLPRTLKAAEMAEGLFESKALKIMAIRVFKMLEVTKFSYNLACCCAISDDMTSSGYHRMQCRGPQLDLSSDCGQNHICDSMPSGLSRHEKENLDSIRRFQDYFDDSLSNQSMIFDGHIHSIVPDL